MLYSNVGDLHCKYESLKQKNVMLMDSAKELLLE